MEAKAVIIVNVVINEGCIISAREIFGHDAVVCDCYHINSGSIVASMGKVPAETKLDYGMILRLGRRRL